MAAFLTVRSVERRKATGDEAEAVADAVDDGMPCLTTTFPRRALWGDKSCFDGRATQVSRPTVSPSLCLSTDCL